MPCRPGAVGGAGSGVDQPLDSRLLGGEEQLKGSSGIDSMVLLGVLNGPRNRGDGGLVKDDRDALTGLSDGMRIAQIPLDQLNAMADLGQILPFASLEIVEDPNAVSPIEQGFDQVRSDKASSARHQHSASVLQQTHAPSFVFSSCEAGATRRSTNQTETVSPPQSPSPPPSRSNCPLSPALPYHSAPRPPRRLNT